jgi:sarcosine oxidase, subunit gamma
MGRACMSDTVPPRSALASATRFEGTGNALALKEWPLSTLLHLEGAQPGPELNAFLAALGLSEPPAIGMSGGRNGTWLLCLGPAIWLLALDSQAAVPETFTLAGGTGRAFEMALDVSHAHTRIEITGERAAEFIAKSCALDLHPRKFAPRACATAGFAGMRTILWRTMDGAGFNLLVGRSYAASMWRWMIDASAEYNGFPDNGGKGSFATERVQP